MVGAIAYAERGGDFVTMLQEQVGFKIGAEHHLFHAELRSWRLARGITQKQLAQMSGLGHQRVNVLENFRAFPSSIEKAALARVTGLPEDRLFPAWLQEWTTGSKRVTTEHETTEFMLSEPVFKMLPAPLSVEDEVIGAVDRGLLKACMGEVLGSIGERERRVIELRYGFDQDGEPRTLDTVAAEIGGLTRERTRQIEAKALRKLRHPTRAERLRPFSDQSDDLLSKQSLLAIQAALPKPDPVVVKTAPPVQAKQPKVVVIPPPVRTPVPVPAVPKTIPQYVPQTDYRTWLAAQVGRRDPVGLLAFAVTTSSCCTQGYADELRQHAIKAHEATPAALTAIRISADEYRLGIGWKVATP